MKFYNNSFSEDCLFFIVILLTLIFFSFLISGVSDVYIYEDLDGYKGVSSLCCSKLGSLRCHDGNSIILVSKFTIIK